MIQVHSPQFITAQTEQFTIDVLGGVDLQQIERMVSTLRISYKDYPPLRSTLDLYNDNQTDKLIRTLCEKWELQLLEVSKTVHGFICELEKYKLERLKYPKGEELNTFELTEDERQTAKKYLTDRNLIRNLKNDFTKLGILGEDENALILFLAMASHKYENPFSVLCLAKSGIGKSYLLQKLSSCMPENMYSFHTQISENALYYFDSHQIDGKVLFIEDLDWTHQMLMPLATLQTQGKLIKTRATKNKDGLLHSTTFEVSAKLCLIACAYSEKNYENLTLPFLCLHLNHSKAQDIEIMDYQRKISAGLIDKVAISQTAHRLKCLIASLEPIQVINPFATLIELPKDLPHPRKTLLLLLDFINVVTFFFQNQRKQVVNEQTGEIYIETAPEDIKLAFSLLKNSLLRKVDELSTSARGFYNWLKKFLTEANTKQFTALDIRKTKQIHPRTLNRYLQELTLFNYVQIIGGNKHRGGFIYKLTDLNELTTLHNNIEISLQNTLNRIGGTSEPKQEPTKEVTTKAEPTKNEAEKQEQKRVRINDNYKHTLKLLLELEAKEPKRSYQPNDFTKLTGRSYGLEAVYLKTLWEKKILNREMIDSRYIYTLSESYEPNKIDPDKIKKSPERVKKVNRIDEKEKYTLKLILELEAQEPNREYHPKDFMPITGRSKITEARHLKTLWEQGILNREYRDRQYFYTLNKSAMTTSKTVSQTAMSNSQTLATQEKDSRTTTNTKKSRGSTPN